MNDRDPVMLDLERFLTESEEDYVDPFDAEQDRLQYLADQMEDHDLEW